MSGKALPAVVVDLDAFDRNVQKAAWLVRSSGKRLRLATKSIRVPELIARALKLSQGTFQGLMCFSAEEARFLRTQGFDDFLVAYPTLQPSDLACLRELHDGGARITITVDHPEHVRALGRAMTGVSRPFPVLLDVDVSLRFLGGLIHLGVRRSRIRSVKDALELCDRIGEFKPLETAGLMAYEAQVAGLGDRNPFKRLLNPIAGLDPQNLSPARRPAARGHRGRHAGAGTARVHRQRRGHRLARLRAARSRAHRGHHRQRPAVLAPV